MICRRTSYLLAATSMIALTALAHPAPAGAAPDDAFASAAYGEAEIWWQRKPSDRTRRELVFRAGPDAAPRVLAVPATGRGSNYSDLALGLDARGRLVAVLESRLGLRWTRVSGPVRLRRVPGSTGLDARPSLFRGRLACIGIVRGAYTSVRVGSLTRGGARTVWWPRLSERYAPIHVAIGARDAVAVIAHKDGAAEGAYRALLLRPGSPPKRLLPTVALGDRHEGGLALDGVSTDGRRVTIIRRFDEEITRFTFALPSGRKL
jgi:hypothetical protein